VQRTEGFALEPDAVLGVHHAQWGRYRLRADLAEAGLPERVFEHAGTPRLNGPGWPAAGGGSWARRRMIATGTEKKPLRSAVE